MLTKINFKELLNYHERNNYDVTVAVKKFDFQFPYGILKIKNMIITSVAEKPLYHYDVSAVFIY